MVSKKLGEEWRGWTWSLFKEHGLYLGSVFWCGHECWSLWQGGEGGSVVVKGLCSGALPLCTKHVGLFFYLYMKFYALAGFSRSAASFSPCFVFLLHEWRRSLNQIFVPVICHVTLAVIILSPLPVCWKQPLLRLTCFFCVVFSF